jgi:hypothetical protein
MPVMASRPGSWPPPSCGPYLLRFAQEAAWREDNRRRSNGEQLRVVAGLAMSLKAISRFLLIQATTLSRNLRDQAATLAHRSKRVLIMSLIWRVDATIRSLAFRSP